MKVEIIVVITILIMASILGYFVRKDNIKTDARFTIHCESLGGKTFDNFGLECIKKNSDGSVSIFHRLSEVKDLIL